MTTSAAPEPEAPRARAAFLLAALVLAEIVAAVESTMIFAALRTLVREFGDPVAVGWTTTAFLLTAAASAAVGARLGDQYGRRRLLLVALVLAGVGSLVSALSPGIAGVIAGRAIQGLAGAAMPLCFGLVRENLPAARVPFGIGVVSAAAIVSAGAAIFAGGLIVDRLDWHWIFVVGFVTAVVAWLAVAAWVPRSRRAAQPEPVDIVGALLLVPAITALLLALSQGRAWGWHDIRTLALAAGGAALLAAWARHEWRTPAPLIDVRLLRDRQLALANLAGILVALGPMQAGIVLSLLLQQPEWTGAGLGLSATQSGALLAPPMMLALVAGPACGVLAARHGARRPALVACALLAAGWGGIAIHPAGLAFLGTMVVLQSLGMAMAYATTPMLIVEVAPHARTSEVTGVATVLRHVFNAVGSQLIAVMLATASVSDPARGPARYPAASAFALALAAIALLCLAALVVTWRLPRRAVTGPAIPRAEIEVTLPAEGTHA